ncbi:hypothetical protein HGRIS_012639 [Hohenbuehelia grisea]|uniref:Uncharacterized protein n=1 Tax=Hohenbuehelia grisea TaxID=104357 RepID=A0ABR3ISW0_9AGAR
MMLFKSRIILAFAVAISSVLCARQTLGQINRGILRAIDGVYLLQNVVAEITANSTHAAAVYANIMAVTYDLKAIRADCNANEPIDTDDGAAILTLVAQHMEPLASVMKDLVVKVGIFNLTTIDGDNARRIVGIALVQLIQACDSCWSALDSKMEAKYEKNQLNLLRDAVQIPMGDAAKVYYGL